MNSGYVKSFKGLRLYRTARVLSREVFLISMTFPKEEKFSLTDQIRRSSRSIGAQVAEAWARRKYEKHFVSKLVDADGEQMETQYWIETAIECGYLSHEKGVELNGYCESIGKMIGTMISKIKLFLQVLALWLAYRPTDYRPTDYQLHTPYFSILRYKEALVRPSSSAALEIFPL